MNAQHTNIDPETERAVKRAAHLARLTLDGKDVHKHTQNFANILEMVKQIDHQDVQGVAPMSSPFGDIQLCLREDVITEVDVRDTAQKIAPATESGFYLVPKVIDND